MSQEQRLPSCGAVTLETERRQSYSRLSRYAHFKRLSTCSARTDMPRILETTKATPAAQTSEEEMVSASSVNNLIGTSQFVDGRLNAACKPSIRRPYSSLFIR